MADNLALNKSGRRMRQLNEPNTDWLLRGYPTVRRYNRLFVRDHDEREVYKRASRKAELFSDLFGGQDFAAGNFRFGFL